MEIDKARRIALIADDDEYFRMALATILRDRFGFSDVVETASFDEAIDWLEGAGEVSLAIFDLAMPGMAGPAMLRAIRESFKVQRLAVVSASRRRSDILLSLDAGAHGFVSKGFGIRELSAGLQKILDGSIYVPDILADLEVGAHSAPAPEAGARAADTPPPLTPRQREVLAMLVAGKSNKEIARELNLGQGTVKVHLAALFRNLGVVNRASAAVAGTRLLQRAPASKTKEANAAGAL